MLLTSSVRNSTAVAEKPIDYRRQVQPLLSDRCFHCHGPDAKNQDSDYRMDSKENLLADLGGYSAIVPGDLENSELYVRIHSTDEYEVMPPPDSNRALSSEEKKILDQWIEQGAPYQGHWAFDRPVRSDIPNDLIADTDWDDDTKTRWSQNPIDAFIARQLIDKEWEPAAVADPGTLLRRAALTLTGLLPPPELQDAFLKAPTDEAYQNAVDELMGSMDYAEHQALRWLDAARYADTDGYQNDAERTNWPWRDWVIKAMHQNMPFDQFTIEQLAGDMLPQANPSQLLATAFNRNHRQNGEGGALAEEFAVENVIDRVETTSTVWLGLTMGCCRCHDHKYDPISQREFYRFYGYFNNIGERGIGPGTKANPLLKSYSPLAEFDQKWIDDRDAALTYVNDLKKEIDERLKSESADSATKETDSNDEWSKATIVSADLAGDGELKIEPEQTVRYTGQKGARNQTYTITLSTELTELSSLRIDALVDPAFAKPRQLAPSVNGNFVLTDLKVLVDGNERSIAASEASFEQNNYPITASTDDDPKSGWAVFGQNVTAEPVSAAFWLTDPVKLTESDSIVVKLRFASASPNHAIGKFRIQLSSTQDASLPTSSGLPPQLESALAKPAESRNDKESATVNRYFETIDPAFKEASAAFRKAKAELRKRTGPEVNVMIMREQEQASPIYLLNRGQYNEPVKDDPLTRGVPAVLLPNEDDAIHPEDRLQFARWLVSADNPLTARVIVNRIWQDHFGVGLVKTADDFGLQGERPSHPELLDWLAVEFIESGWDIQAIHRLIVTSAAYQQSSRHNRQHSEIDPENRLISRGPRFRTDGFVIRDVALQAAGLLSDTVGGPSVKPYQPNGLWSSVAGRTGIRYSLTKGDGLYRKSMYTYWKRAVNPPRQTIFDASTREVCSVRVRRTNTPLQALVLMNDPTFVESARQLAERTLNDDTLNDLQRIEAMYRLAVGRSCDDQTSLILSETLEHFRDHFSTDPDSAKKLLTVGDSSRDEAIQPVEHASLTVVAHLILNLDEFLSVE